MTVTGSWVRRNTDYAEPMFGPWSVVDKRHSDREGLDPRRESAFQAPAYPGAAPVVETYVEVDTLPRTDTTPITRTGVPRNPNMTPAELWGVHVGGHGAELAATKTFPRFLKFGDEINVVLQQDHTRPPAARDAGGRPDLTRGLNAFGANNPVKEMYEGEGWRRAWWQSRRDEHRLSQPMRFHRWRIVQRWVAAAPVNRAATPGTVQTGLQWPGLARSIRNNYDRPMMRRQPGLVGEDAVRDGLDEPVAQSVGEFI